MKVCLNAFLLMTTLVACAKSDLASKPPMGWMSGQRYYCNADCNNYPDDCISEKLVTRQISAMKSHQMASLGYEYILLSDGWMAKTRNSEGKLQVDADRFPNGLKSVADMVHAANMKLGVYISVSNTTACGYPGAQGHKEADAKTLAEWGVDMVYIDAASFVGDSQALNQAYQDMIHYLSQTSRLMLYSCLWPYYVKKMGAQPDWDLITKTCHTFRVYDDMLDSWEKLHDVLKHFGDEGSQYINQTGPGHWTDPGQLLVGGFGLSENQQEMQLAVWATMGAPLMLSSDLTKLSAPALNLLSNKMAIAVNQDSVGVMGKQKSVIGQVRIWMRPVSPSGSFALALLYENVSGGPSKVSVKLQDLGMTTAAAYNFTDVFSGKDMGTYKPWYTFNTEVNPTGVRFIYAKALP